MRAFVSATTCLFGLSSVCGSGSASNASTIAFGGSTYFGESEAVGTCAVTRGPQSKTTGAKITTARMRACSSKRRVDMNRS